MSNTVASLSSQGAKRIKRSPGKRGRGDFWRIDSPALASSLSGCEELNEEGRNTWSLRQEDKERGEQGSRYDGCIR